MADTVKLPVLGPTKKPWVIAGVAGIAGIVGYAYWTRGRAVPGETSPELTADDIPQDRSPPPTVVGSEDFDTGEVREIINTNPEWYTQATEYLVSTGGFDFMFVTVTLGKFLARRQLTEQEANLVQAAKGAVGEPPQGGPWPVIRTTAPGPSLPGSTKLARPTIRYSAGSPANTNYAISWTRVTGAAYYEIQRSAGPGAPSTRFTTSTSMRTPALDRGKTYGYRVRARSVTKGVASSDWSSETRFVVPGVRKAA